MYCKYCGKEVVDDAVFCPHCGAKLAENKAMQESADTDTNVQQGDNVLAVVGFILSFFVSIAGLICSIMAYKKCKEEGLNYKNLAVAGIAISGTFVGLKVITILLSWGILLCTPFMYL